MSESSPHPGRARLLSDFVRYGLAAASVAPRTLLSVARGHLEPDIPDGGDFGRMRWRDHEIARAGSVDELRTLLAAARSAGRYVTVTGSRHSANGQTLPPEGGLQIRLDRDTGSWTAPHLVGDDLVRISACHTWRTLQAFLREHGLCCPVLTDHLTTTIGGTLSVGGGIGTSSVGFGRQLDRVEGFTLVLPNGDVRWCDADENPGLFRHAMGGMGELGVIDEVVMRARRYRPFLAVHRYQATSLREAMRAVRDVLLHPELPAGLTHLVVEGPILGTPFIQFEFGFEAEDEAAARAALRQPPAMLAALHPLRRVYGHQALVAADQSNDRHNRSAAFVASIDGHKHIWNDFFFADYASYERFLTYTEETVFAQRGHRHLLSGLAFAYPGDPLDPVDPAHRRAAFSYPFREAERYRWSFGFNYSVPDGPEVAETVQSLAMLREEATRLGAGVYGYGYNDRGPADFEQAYGDIVRDFLALRAEVDPDGRFGGGLPLRGESAFRGATGT